MAGLVEIAKMLTDLSEYGDLTQWEETFVQSLIDQVEAKDGRTTMLSSKQVEKLEQIHNKHFK